MPSLDAINYTKSPTVSQDALAQPQIIYVVDVLQVHSSVPAFSPEDKGCKQSAVHTFQSCRAFRQYMRNSNDAK